MTFLMGWPLLLSGILLASIPIVIHLLHRQRTTPIHWGAMRFLLESQLQARRRRRVDQWLLLAVRVAALLLLAWALARPIVSNGITSKLGTEAPTDVAFVLDHSLSMSRVVGDQTLFDQAAAIVEESARTLGHGDTLSIILAEHEPRALSAAPAPAGDAVKLCQSLRQLKPGMTDCSMLQAIGVARQMLSHGSNARKLVLVLSDQQRANWQIGDPGAWRAATGTGTASDNGRASTYNIALQPPKSAANVSVGAITVEPNLVGINRPSQILAAISNQGSTDFTALAIHMAIDGRESATPMQIPSLPVGQSVTVRFDHTFAAAGSHWVKIWTDAIDALPADNSAVAAINVWQRLPVLIVDGQLTRAGNFQSAQFLAAAMQPLDPARAQSALIQPTIVSVADSSSANLDDYFAIVINDVAELPPDIEQRLADYTSAGHGVWIILGPRTRADFITDALGPQRTRLAKLGMTDASPQSASSPPAVEIRSPSNPMVALIASSDRNALAGAATVKWWRLKPEDGDDQIILATADGDPLVLEHPVGNNGGRAVIWATSADGSWNNWNVMPNFVPLVNETIYHLCAPILRGQKNGSINAGSAILWSGPPKPALQSADVTLPDGSIDRDRKPDFRSGQWEFQYPNTFQPGLYQVKFRSAGAMPPVYFAVGIDPRELEPTVLSDADQRWLTYNASIQTISTDQIAAAIARQPGAGEIWKWLAGFLLLSLLVETALTWQMMGRQRTRTEAAPARNRVAA
ncbi:MAG TPA: BatA domain-containing protein [Humisphaera sp.]|jgi:hypothetical protein|nr:BatA domain-containing protein [Humisphaera sp.]